MAEPATESVLKESADAGARQRAIWASGDFGKIAQHQTMLGASFVERLNVQPNIRILDVACGTGNVAIPAARAGAHVAGIDIVPALLERARARAAAENLSIDFKEGDAETLPYGDAEFDLVASQYGAMFAPHPERVAKEMGRVCALSGRIAMANWTSRSIPGKIFAITARYLPPPAGVPSSVLWGDEDVARERLCLVASHVELQRQPITMHFPLPPRKVVQLFREYYGPTMAAFSRLDAPTQKQYAADLEDLWTTVNQGGSGETVVETEHLEVIAYRG